AWDRARARSGRAPPPGPEAPPPAGGPKRRSQDTTGSPARAPRRPPLAVHAAGAPATARGRPVVSPATPRAGLRVVCRLELRTPPTQVAPLDGAGLSLSIVRLHVDGHNKVHLRRCQDGAASDALHGAGRRWLGGALALHRAPCEPRLMI